MTAATFTATAAGMDSTLLQVAAALVGVPLLVVSSSGDGADHTNGGTSASVSLLMTSAPHAFTGISQHLTAVGLVGSLRLLLEATNSATGAAGLGGQSTVQKAAVESWIQTADLTLLPILRQADQKDTIYTAAVEDFLEHVEVYLLHNHQTVLVGDTYTLADAVVALAIAETCLKLSIVNLQQQVYRWCLSTLHKLSALDNFPLSKDDFGKYDQQLKEGKTSPLQLPSAIKTAPPTPAAPVPAPAPVAAAPVPAPAPVAAAPVPAPAPAPAATPAPVAAPPASVAVPAATPASADASENAVLQALNKFGITFTVYDHVACGTAEELVQNVPLPDDKHSHTKNLFLRDKKHGLFLITVRPSAHVDTKNVGQQLKLAGKTNLRLADESILWEELRVKPGCVGPLCMIQDGIKKETITLVLDQALLQKYEQVHSHPLRNDKSVSMTPDALKQALSQAGVEPVVLEFPEASDVVSAGKAPANRPPATKTPPEPKETQDGAPAAETKKVKGQHEKKSVKKGETLLALQWKKKENFPMWYTDVIVLSEMISYYDISGCYILRPWSYKIWELIQEWFNGEIQEMGVENAYFPLFVSQERLEREKDHVEGFAPEVAWVTKSGEGDLAKPIAIRPTSETIMYPAYSDWIKSHRDLPLKLNQWSNVVRWEFKYPTPFLRTREFLWQEGHTAHSTFEDADKTVMEALDLYRQVYEDLLAVPVIPGYKTEAEKFAGGYRTTTVEAYIAGSGRAIQGATSHNLGQNFGKMFDITFQDEKGETVVAWQTSWGLTTRTIGVMVMVHGDDTGLVLPPRVAPLQVVIVPIISKKFTSEDAAPYCAAILKDLKAAGIRAKNDDRDLYNPGWKYNHWEQKGVPIRIEVGPRDVEQKSARIVIRHDGSKEDLPVEGLGETLKTKLKEIQAAMFTKAKEARDSHIVQVTEWKDFVPNLEKHNLVLTPWCGGEHKDWEKWVKETSREESLKALGEEAEDDKTATSVAAKTLCIPFTQPELPPGTKCIASGLDATCWVLWGRSY